MRQQTLKYLAGGLCLALVLCVGCSRKKEPKPAVYEITKTIRYSLNLRNTSGEAVADVPFRVNGPVQETATQRTLELSASDHFILHRDELGNQVLEFKVSIPPYGTKIISVEAKMALAREPNEQLLPIESAFLKPEPLIEVEHPRIQEVAQALAGKSEVEIAQSAFDWVGNNLERAGYLRDDRGAAYAIEEGKGDSTEAMYLFAALTRAREISTRPVSGFVIKESGLLRSRDFHSWAEFYDGDAWHLADPIKKNFAAREAHYIAMRILGEGERIPMTSSHRFTTSHEGIEVGMN